MLGIDIVDLKDKRTHERNNRSFRFIQHEKDHLIEHPDIFWLLWAAKEAIFKCKRELVDFSPKSIPVHIKSDHHELTFTSDVVNGKFVVNKDYLLAICSKVDFNRLSYQVFSTNKTMNSKLLREKTNSYFQGVVDDFAVGSDELNLPIALPSKQPISFTHHNSWGAVAFFN